MKARVETAGPRTRGACVLSSGAAVSAGAAPMNTAVETTLASPVSAGAAPMNIAVETTVASPVSARAAPMNTGVETTVASPVSAERGVDHEGVALRNLSSWKSAVPCGNRAGEPAQERQTTRFARSEPAGARLFLEAGRQDAVFAEPDVLQLGDRIGRPRQPDPIALAVEPATGCLPEHVQSARCVRRERGLEGVSKGAGDVAVLTGVPGQSPGAPILICNHVVHRLWR